MDLDNLKEVWRSQDQQAGPQRSREEVMTILTRQSKLPVARMKRNLFIELIVMIVSMGGVGIYYLFAFGGTMREVSWVYLLTVALFLVYYFRKNKLLNELQCVSCHVKSNLQQQIRTLEKYLRTYLIGATLMIPLLMLFLGWLFYFKVPSETPRSIFFHSPAYPGWQTLLVWAGMALLVSFPSYYLNKKYFHWLYGKHVSHLKKIVAEMEQV